MKIPDKPKKLMEQGKIIAFATCTKDGVPNVVPMLQYWWFAEGILVVGDMFMRATRENVEQNGRVSFSVWDDATGEAYKFRGTAAYETAGAAYDMANNNLHKKKPDKNFKGVMVVTVTEIHDAARGENAGKLIAKA